MTEFDPFAFLSWFVPLTVSSIIGGIMYFTKNTWLKSKTEANTANSIILNQNMVTNAIKEIELIKIDLKNLVNEMQTHKINSTRLEERVKYMADTLEFIRSDIRNLSSRVSDSNNIADDRERRRVQDRANDNNDFMTDR